MPAPSQLPPQGTFNWTALISGVVSIASAVSMAAGHPVLGAIISSPDTSQALTGIVGGVGALVAMFSPSALKSLG